MAQLIIVYWRDMPAQVIVKQGRTSAKRELPERFVPTLPQKLLLIIFFLVQFQVLHNFGLCQLLPSSFFVYLHQKPA